MILYNNNNKVKKSAEDFINSLNHEVCILGTNKYGLNAAKWLEDSDIKVKGFINDFIACENFESYTIIHSSKVPKQSSIINCITEGRTIDAEENIISMEPSAHIDYFALQHAFPKKLIEIDFLEDTGSIPENIERYRALYSRLKDEESKITLENISNFRLSRDINYLKEFKFRINEQYFEPFLKLSETPVFVDGGGFDGETSILFSKLYPSFKYIWYFEPNAESLENSRVKLMELGKIKLFNKGLWNKSENLYFDNTLGSASRLSEKGKLIVETIALDEIINGKVDFIKLDIEGAEYNALTGAERLIKQFKPAIAVCVYHNQMDFIRIPELLLDYIPEYNIYLRHYSRGVFETIMYFI